jgi:hypothetical protein
MRTAILVGLTFSFISVPGFVSAQRTEIPTDGAPRLSGPTVTSFVINGGATTIADRDVTYQIQFEGTSALYRIADGVRPTGGWLLAYRGVASGNYQLTRGLEGTRTLYLEIRKDATSPTTVKTTSITLKFPRQVFAASGRSLHAASTASGYTDKPVKIGTSGDSCYYSDDELSAWGNFPAAAAMGIPVAPSPEAVCEIRMMGGKNLKPGWTLKSVSVKLIPATWNVTILDGSRCSVKSAAFGTNVPAVTVLLKHPGSINPLASVATMCRLLSVEFTGPDDPDVNEGLGDIL